jgi:protein SCO1/2
VSSFRPKALCGQLLVLGLLLVWVVGCTAPTRENAVVRQDSDPAGYLGGTSVPEPYTMPDRTLTDTSGRPYNLVSSPSKPVTLMFFGYTKCPDVCLTVLSDVAQALNRLDPAVRDQIQLVFVTTDPARDKAKVVGSYLQHFDPTFVGLTGDLSTIKWVAERVGVDIEGMKRLPGGGYEVGHSAQVIGFDKQHRGVVIWTPSTPIGDLSKDFEHLVVQQR